MRPLPRSVPLLWFALVLAIASCKNDGSSSDRSTNSADDDDDDSSQEAMDGGRKDAGKDAGSRVDAGGNPPRDSGGASADRGLPPSGNDGGGDGEPTACDPSTAPTIPKLALEPVVTGLNVLVTAVQPPGSSDWYLVEQGGTIRVFSGGELRPEPFLDIGDQVPINGNPATTPFDDERGLLGLAFPPDYESSGKFYVMLTPTTEDSVNRDTVVEYTRSADDPMVADPSPERTLLELGASQPNHNGGNIEFGPDGMLYVGTGDGGGSCGDSMSGAPQDTNANALFGKILRLDPNASAPNYAAAGNPFASDGDARVWHYGLRNPFRFGFDRETGDMYIGDVGQDGYEELDFAPSGASGLNFGWAAFEGKHSDRPGCITRAMLRSGSTHTEPIFEADRRRGQTGPYADWTSVIGGRVYRGSALPQLRGVYIFGDYEGRRMVALRQCGTQTSMETAILKNRDANAPNSPAFTRASGDPAFNHLSAIVEDNEGELYFVANFDRLLKVVPGE